MVIIYRGSEGIHKVLNKPTAFTTFFFVALRPFASYELILKVPRSHTTMHHIGQDSSGLVISPTHRPLPDNTQQTSTQPAGFKPTISAGGRPQTYALDRSATGTGFTNIHCHLFIR